MDGKAPCKPPRVDEGSRLSRSDPQHPSPSTCRVFSRAAGFGHPWTAALPPQPGLLSPSGSFCHRRELVQALKYRDTAPAEMSVFLSDTKHNANEHLSDRRQIISHLIFMALLWFYTTSTLQSSF